MLTPENIAFLDKMLLMAIADVAPASSRDVFHQYLHLTGPQSPVVDEVVAQDMRLYDVATEYSTINRLASFVADGRVVKITIHLPSDDARILYAPKGSWVE